MDLTSAIKNKDIERVKVLLQRDNVHGNNEENNADSLSSAWAAFDGTIAIVQLLLDSGADINGLSSSAKKKRYTALSFATSNNNIPLMKFLLSKMADPNKGDLDARLCTPLYQAAAKSHLEAVEVLLSTPNIDTTIENNCNETAADVAKNDLIKKLIQIKYYEQQREKLCKEVPEIKLAAIREQIVQKEYEIADASIKVENLLKQISDEMNQLEVLRMEMPVLECEFKKLNVIKSDLMTVRKRAFELPWFGESHRGEKT